MILLCCVWGRGDEGWVVCVLCVRWEGMVMVEGIYNGWGEYGFGV